MLSLIHIYLDKEGFDVRIAADGGKAVEEFKEKEPDLVLLDVMLPVLDGWGVCAKIRETSKCPIIMLTAKGEVNDRIHGLEMGADDYVVKPFEMKELLARINAVLRRSEIPEDTHKRLTFDKLIIDLDSYELIVDGKKIDTPPKELELLYHLAAKMCIRDRSSPLRTWSLRLIGWLWAVYGAFAFRRRDVSLYLLLRSHFVFYDYSEPVLIFLIDYLSVMVVFVLIGYYFIQGLKRLVRLGQGLCRIDGSDFHKRG